MSITAKELAKILGISEAAVSLALNNKPGVSKQTRKRVLDACEQYGYDFSNRSLYLSNNQNGAICLVLYKRTGAVVSDTPFFSSLIEGVGNVCRRNHYKLNIVYIYENNDLREQLLSLNASGSVGIIFLATELLASSVPDLALIRPPFVLLDAFFDSQSYDSILINNVQGAYHATNFLISQCRCQPGYLHSSFPISNFEERANGFYNSIRYNGMSASKSIVHKLTPSQEGAYSDMKAIIESGEELATAYFADNDLIAVGAMRALISAGYRIPEDISIVGFDDLPLCEYVTPPLTTIHVPKQYMGEKAAERLLELINTKDHYPIKIEINTQLKERSSVRPRGRQ